MRKIIAIAFAMLFATLQMNAQKVGYIDTEKILSAIPAYRSAQSQLESLGKQYQEEIEMEYAKIETLYNNYQAQKVNMSAQARQVKENEIIQKEKAVKELQQRYFGQNGNMQAKSEQLLNPIKERVEAAIKTLAQSENYMIVFDVAAMQGVAYKDSAYDLSNRIIRYLGY